jgi:hypothetical protein
MAVREGVDLTESGGPMNATNRSHIASDRWHPSVLCAFALLVMGCDTPHTNVVLENHYPPSATNAKVVYRAFWQAVLFATPVPPGFSSEPQDSVPASPNAAYVLLAPGWDRAADGGTTTPTSFVVLQSRGAFELHVDQTLRIVVDDRTFAGDCSTGSALTQEETDFITRRVFATDFAGLHYDAATCKTTSGP